MQNRHDVKMNVWVDDAGENAPVVFVMHGFSGNIKQPHMRAMTEAFRANGYTTVAIDATNSFNTSGGAIEKANVLRHAEDLEDTIAWARTQPWFKEPFALTGQSMGGGAVLHYAVQNPRSVSLLVPAATLVSGQMYVQALEQNNPRMLKEWKDNGFLTMTFNGQARKRYWDVTMDGYGKLDMVRDAHKLTMLVFLIAGEKDTTTPPWTMKALHDALPGEKKLHIIAGAHHVFDRHEPELNAVMKQWIAQIHTRTPGPQNKPFTPG